jgi:DNA (cytosine-5)-methyltransferase 1
MKLNVLDLFSGCGGLSWGFHNNKRFKVVVANDVWIDALNTYKLNYPKTNTVLGDINSQVVKNNLLQHFTPSKPCDVIIGGPPCQAYSMAGYRDTNDPRAQLFSEYLSMVSALQPRICIMENVKGILSVNYKNTTTRVINKIVEEFAILGYSVEYKLLNSANYGVPQRRERLIIIATKNGEPSIGHPIATHNENTWISVREAIDSLQNQQENKMFSHIFTNHNNDITTKIRNTAIGHSMNPKYKEAFYKCDPDKPSLTVKENHGGVFLHYNLPRVMTPRELARLQSFPDNFIFTGSKSSILKQIGNAVPVGLGIKIANQIAKYLPKRNK